MLENRYEVFYREKGENNWIGGYISYDLDEAREMAKSILEDKKIAKCKIILFYRNKPVTEEIVG